MSIAIIDGIATRFEVVGSGPPLLMFSPAGFDATLGKWRTQEVSMTAAADHPVSFSNNRIRRHQIQRVPPLAKQGADLLR
jgi:hypothetical protein